MSVAAEVAKKLLQIKAIKLSPQRPFTWASGILSPIYCDNRILLSYPLVRDYIKKCLIDKAKTFEGVNMIVGVATAGIPHGALLADALGIPFAYVRSKAKAHGRQNLIEGEVRGVERVLIIEDLISTGGSSLDAVRVIEAKGCKIEGVLAIFSYDLPQAKENFEAEDCAYYALSNYNILLDEALKCNYIQASDFNILKAWRENPKEWGTKFV